MTPDPDSALDGLTLVIEAVRASTSLQRWFLELARVSDRARREVIRLATQEMRVRGEPEDLISAFQLLAHPALFAGVSSALREVGVEL